MRRFGMGLGILYGVLVFSRTIPPRFVVVV